MPLTLIEYIWKSSINTDNYMSFCLEEQSVSFYYYALFDAYLDDYSHGIVRFSKDSFCDFLKSVIDQGSARISNKDSAGSLSISIGSSGNVSLDMHSEYGDGVHHPQTGFTRKDFEHALVLLEAVP